MDINFTLEKISTIWSAITYVPTKTKAFLFSRFFQSQPVAAPDTLSKKQVNLVCIPGDGNCAFQAILTALEDKGIDHGIQNIEQLRNKVADWMRENILSDQALQGLIIESAQEHLEIRLESLSIEENELTYLASVPEIDVDQLNRRVSEIAQAKQAVETQLEKIKDHTSLHEIALTVSDYLEKIRSNIDTERVYASRAHYYAFTKIFDFPVSINVYIERKDDLLLVDRHSQKAIEIHLLHSGGNHIDLLQTIE